MATGWSGTGRWGGEARRKGGLGRETGGFGKVDGGCGGLGEGERELLKLLGGVAVALGWRPAAGPASQRRTSTRTL